MHTRRLLVVSLLCAFAFGCYGNESGHVAATGTGDVSNPPAERRSPIEEYEAACGSGDATTAGVSLHRHPYLQRMTQTGVSVMWTAAETEGAVEISLPTGEVLAEVTATVDAWAHAVAATQMNARMEGLQASTVYCYRVLAGDDVLTERAGFRTAPAPASGATVRFVAFGDSGAGGADQEAVTAQLFTVGYDLLLHTGDIAYEDGTLEELESYYFDAYGELLRSIVSFPIAGNHDYHSEAAGPYREAFDLPDEERWFSYDYGDVHFVALDTEQVNGAQKEWLETDLAANTLPWVIAYGHKPPYSSGQHGSEVSCRDAFEPILARHGAQLWLSGHDHDYERTLAIQGITHIVSGGGGKGTRAVGHSPFTVFSEDVLHFVYGEVTADRLALHAIDATGREFDSLVIEAPRP
jgi:acid phosphatase type 7